MSRVHIRDITVAYDDTGIGLPVVLVHGHPFDRSMWRYQVDALGGRYRMITYDLRGYGESAVVPGKTTLEEFARDLAGLLDYLDVPEIVLGGLSMGGQIVLEFYRSYPERVSALVLADTFAQLDAPAGRQARLEMADSLMRDGWKGYADEVLPRMIAPKTIREQPGVAAHVLRMMRGTSAAGAAAALRGRAERRDYTPLLAAISVPTLIVVGSDDEFTPVSDAELMHRGIPGSRLEVIAGTGHMPNVERPEEFNRILGEFLDSLEE